MPLKWWLVGTTLQDCLFFAYLCVKIPKLKQALDARAVVSNSFAVFLMERVFTVYFPSSLYLAWQIPGNIWFWSCKDCYSDAPVLTGLVFSFLCIGYLVLLAPVLSLLASCLCAPCLILGLIFLSNSSFLADTEALIGKLEGRQYTGEEQYCAICNRGLTGEGLVVGLGCDLKHVFHENCVKRWLRVQCCCPVCRSPLALPIAS